MRGALSVNGRRVVFVGGLFALLLLSGTAFAHTFGSSLAFQQRDEITFQQSGLTLEDETVTVAYTVTNPLDRSVELYGVEMVVYEGGPPFEDGRELTVRRRARLAGGDRVIEAGETATVRVELPTASTPSRVEAAIEAGDAVPSGIFNLRLGDREFMLEVVPSG